MGWQTVASRLYSARRVMKQLNGKEDISILCEILLHFISVFFPTLITFPVVSSDTLTVTRAWLCGWCFNVWSPLFVFFVFFSCLGQSDKHILSERRKGPVGRPARAKPCACVYRSCSVLARTQTCRAETSEKQRRMLAVHEMSEPAVGIIRDSYRESNLSPGAGACFAADDT